MRHGPQASIPHPGLLALALMSSVLLGITWVAAALHGNIGSPTMVTNFLGVATVGAWCFWGVACLISRPRPKQTTPAPPDARELEELLEQWRN